MYCIGVVGVVGHWRENGFALKIVPVGCLSPGYLLECGLELRFSDNVK